jgi:ribosomal protein S18 acetylase RimI-like enzyme
VNINEYAFKIFQKTVRFEAIDQEKLVGLVAIYCNDEKKISAYITSVSVDKDSQGLGIGSKLVDAGIEYVKNLGFNKIELEVDVDNTKAINMYRKRGFTLHENKPTAIAMQLEI